MCLTISPSFETIFPDDCGLCCEDKAPEDHVKWPRRGLRGEEGTGTVLGWVDLINSSEIQLLALFL